MTTAAEFFGDPEVLDELVVLYGADVVSALVPAVMGMLVVREATASMDEKQRIFRTDLRYATLAVFRWIGDPAKMDRYLDQIMNEGIDTAQKKFPAVTAFLDGRFDQFFQEICAAFHIPESG
ncbi:hypothetical protein BBC27_09640 [Acidithiobacillus ferrivorans]|uniref:Uncharacterized protein n=1 Tax=Acidithiobacillus ferrivorans TaxID=160808 RepID=A0A1B9BZH5_9PROT|nr:hypothetical protein [Acidithiobacillus ferrivorans]OCB03101.1 hypothetical protein BBC27_09640 [Acidithiobacillus ferrivorans]